MVARLLAYHKTMSDPAYQYMTEEEYLRTEEFSPVKREYVAGFVYPLHGATLAHAGATSGHGELVVALATLLSPLARQRGCKLYIADMRVNIITPTGRPSYYYPDVIVTCETMGKRSTSSKTPCFIAEILSPSTRSLDQTEKVYAYTALPSLQTYLIVDAERRHIRVIERQANGWTEHELEGEGSIGLPCLGATLTLEQVYEGVLSG
jgi:Uma2 family endonuclease